MIGFSNDPSLAELSMMAEGKCCVIPHTEWS